MLLHFTGTAVTDALAACYQTREAGQQALLHEEITAFEARSGQTVRVGRAANLDPPPGGRKPFAPQFADCMSRRREDFLCLLHDLMVPFTNN